MPVNLIIFDFDGTLVDTAPDLIRATNLYLTSLGLEPLPAATIRKHIGMGLRKLILDLYPEQKDDVERMRNTEMEFLALYEREYLVSPRLFEGVLEFLTDWDGQVAIVSNKRERFIPPVLRHLGVDHFPWVKIVGGDTYKNMKPHPEPFLSTIAAAGSTPEETLIVGDGEPDVMGAVAIGSRCVAVEFGYTALEDLMDLGAWRSLTHFSELLPLVRSIT